MLRFQTSRWQKPHCLGIGQSDLLTKNFIYFWMNDMQMDYYDKYVYLIFLIPVNNLSLINLTPFYFSDLFKCINCQRVWNVWNLIFWNLWDHLINNYILNKILQYLGNVNKKCTQVLFSNRTEIYNELCAGLYVCSTTLLSQETVHSYQTTYWYSKYVEQCYNNDLKDINWLQKFG